MNDDSTDIFDIIGTELPKYRNCYKCDCLYAVDKSSCDRPTVICDPGYCDQLMLYCTCRQESIDAEEEVNHCIYPGCLQGRNYKRNNDPDD
jgi:hypothetical protein